MRINVICLIVLLLPDVFVLCLPVQVSSFHLCYIYYGQNCQQVLWLVTPPPPPPLHLPMGSFLQLTYLSTGQGRAVGNVSGYRCESDCRSRGREFDPGPVLYFCGVWSWNNFYGHSPPFHWNHSRRFVVSYRGKYVHEVLVNRLFKPAQEKVWLGKLTVLLI